MGLFKEVKCGRCDRRYSSLRSRCPYCGARKNSTGKKTNTGGGSSQRWQLIVGVVILIAVVVAVILLVSSSLKSKEPADDRPSPSGSLTDPDDGINSVVNSPSPTPESTPTPTPEPTPAPTPTVTSITLNRQDFTLSTIGAQWQMTATTSPAASGAEVTWYSEDETVAIVNETGMVTAINRGSTNIVAMAGGQQAKCIVRVTADSITAPSASPATPGGDTGNGGGDTSSKPTLSNSDVTLKIGKSGYDSFTLKVSGATGTPTYSSSNSSVASVDSSGFVKAVANGDCTISVSVDGETLKCIIRVR